MASTKVQNIENTFKVIEDEKVRIVFIINPVSGTERKEHIVTLIHTTLQPSDIDYDIVYTHYAGHATELAQQATQQKYDVVVAVGGDGTINEIAQALIKTKTALAIIPQGSGNGLARHLGIPLHTEQAIRRLLEPQKILIDAATANGNFFFCTSGIGFDAHVSASFASRAFRGLAGYAYFTMKELFSYKPMTYTLEFDGKTIEKEAFLIAFANATQYGNNVYIAPQADIQDGKLDICILKPFSKIQAPKIMWQVLNRTILQNPYMETHKADSIKISFGNSIPVHIDGEPKGLGTSIEYKSISKALTVWV
ncbi:diacylglycerol/lipid kinase family protein [Bernardetia sp.]|uniref:diacylglycerol/lipid kinase family protein n=1 Tax=Bernardetia sp. TaxID=1937974 RepID=UPI0025BC400A|nr:diacylglycerol kinase family protein [Bernardetia sp.]